MNILINLLIFCTILFLYIHIYNQIKTSEYLELYEIDNPSKEKFEDLCDLKQPLIIKNIDFNNEMFDKDFLNNNYSSFDVKIRSNENDEIFIPIKINKFIELINSDQSSNYISENNKDF